MPRTITDLLLASVVVGVVFSQLAPQGDLNSLGPAANSQPWPGYPPQAYPSPSISVGNFPYGPPPAASPPFMPPPAGNGMNGLFNNPFFLYSWMHSVF